MNEFDEFAKECKSMAFEEGWKRLWTEVFSLEKIIFAVKKPAEEQDEIEPLLFIGSLEEAPCAFAFTDMEHFEDFKKCVEEDVDAEEVSYHEVIFQDYLNATQHLANQNIPFIMMNYGNEFGFHTKNQEISSMYNVFIKGDFLQERRVEEGAMIAVAVPDEINEMKQALEEVRGNYKNVLNHVSPILVKLGERVDLTFVMDFKGGLPVDIKKSIMKNIHKELAVSPLFQTQIYFTEEQQIISPELQKIVQVKF